MSGKRTKDPTLTQQEYFIPTLKVLVDKPDTDSGDWLQARAMELALLGNTYIQGSSNGINWHDDITALDTYFRITTDGGTTWRNLDTDLIREGTTNKYYTETKVSANTDVAANTLARHSHTNKTTLDNIINSGLGTTFLSDDGTYKSLFYRNIRTETSNYNVSNTDDIVLLDGTSNTVTTTLPSAIGLEGKIYTLKSINDTFTCTVDTSLSQTIDGSTSIILSLYESIYIVSNNVNWFII